MLSVVSQASEAAAQRQLERDREIVLATRLSGNWASGSGAKWERDREIVLTTTAYHCVRLCHFGVLCAPCHVLRCALYAT